MFKKDLTSKFEYGIISFIQRTDYKFLFLTVLLIMVSILFPTKWTGNEENYFQLAFQIYSPESFPDNHAVFDSSGARFVSQYFIGAFVGLMGYEGAHYFVRLGMIFLYTVSLTMFFRTLNLRLVDAAGILVIFMLAGQNLMGGEWLFQGVEAKTFAYFFVILAISFTLKDRWWTSLFCLVGSTYWHFLVGAFWTFFIFAWHLYHTRNIKLALQIMTVFIIMTLPITLSLISSVFANVSFSSPVTADYIYAHIRNPHHIAPFSSTFRFVNSWLVNIVITILLCIALFKMIKMRSQVNLAGITLFSGIALVIFILVAFLDRNTFFFSKFYLFRPSSLFLLLSITCFFYQLKRFLNKDMQILYFLLIVIIFFNFSYQAMSKKALQIMHGTNRLVTSELKNVIEEKISKDKTILIEPFKEKSNAYIQVHRDVERPTLVAWKFIPTASIDIYKWYNLINFRNQLFELGCNFDHTVEIEYLILYTEKSKQSFAQCSTELFTSDQMSLVLLNINNK